MDSSPTPTPDSQSNTPVPIFEPSNTPLPITPPKKGNKLPWIIGIVLFLVGVGAAAYFLLFMSKPGQNNAQTVAVESKSPETKKSAAETLVNDIKKAMTAKAVTTKESELAIGGEEPEGTVVYYLPSYQPTGYDYSVNAEKGYGTAVSSPSADKAAIDKDYDAAIVLLEKQKLAKLDGAGYENEGQKYALYHNKEIVCSVNTWYDLRGSNYTGVGCADMTSYVASAKTAKQFHDAYVTANPNVKKTMGDTPPYYGRQTIKEGVEGYKNAEVLMNNFAALFYQTPDAKTWKFFLGTQDTVPCKDFNTDDIKNAFAGHDCYDLTPKKDSTVKASV